MIKVLKHGARKVTCPYCKAELEYEQEDVGEIVSENISTTTPFIVCPDCNNYIFINRIKK